MGPSKIFFFQQIIFLGADWWYRGRGGTALRLDGAFLAQDAAARIQVHEAGARLDDGQRQRRAAAGRELCAGRRRGGGCALCTATH